jgi:hypothetical protein
MGNLAPGNYRLTNSTRERIAKDILLYKFESTNIAELKKDHASIALAVYNSIYTEKEREQIDALPDGWLPMTERINISYGYSDYTSLNFNGSIYNHIGYRVTSLVGHKMFSVEETVQRRMLEKFNRSTILIKDTDLSNRITNHVNKINTTSSEVTTLYRKITAALSSVTTTKKLVEVWPESKPFVTKVFGDSTAKIPSKELSIPVAELNEALGLPVP